MDIRILTKHDVLPFEAPINQFLGTVFDSFSQIELSEEFVCAVLIQDGTDIIGCGFAYQRKMLQGLHQFNAVIIGAIAVSKKYRGNGLCRKILAQLERAVQPIEPEYAFLFAYQPTIYLSSGFVVLKTPIHYFDKTQRQWKQFVYRGGMVKAMVHQPLDEHQVIEFNGCVH